VRKFCSELESNPGPKLTSQQQTLYSAKLSSESEKFSAAFRLGPESGVVSVPASLMSLHDYGPCGLDNLSPDPGDAVRDSTLSAMSHIIDANIAKFFGGGSSKA
jgi:hypothetical protein